MPTPPGRTLRLATFASLARAASRHIPHLHYHCARPFHRMSCEHGLNSTAFTNTHMYAISKETKQEVVDPRV